MYLLSVKICALPLCRGEKLVLVGIVNDAAHGHGVICHPYRDAGGVKPLYEIARAVDGINDKGIAVSYIRLLFVFLAKKEG